MKKTKVKMQLWKTLIGAGIVTTSTVLVSACSDSVQNARTSIVNWLKDIKNVNYLLILSTHKKNESLGQVALSEFQYTVKFDNRTSKTMNYLINFKLVVVNPLRKSFTYEGHIMSKYQVNKSITNWNPNQPFLPWNAKNNVPAPNPDFYYESLYLN